MGVKADKIRKAIDGEEVRETIAQGIEAAEQLVVDYNKQVINAGNSNAEIVNARGTYNQLKDRLDNNDTQLAEKANQSDLDSANTKITNNTNAIALKADVSYVDTKTAALASGSPKNVFATLTALQADATANTTDGKKYIYVVTADGKWYYFNGTAWTVGGTYQATGIAPGSVTATQVTANTTGVVIAGATPINIDFVNLKITIPSGTTIYVQGKQYSVVAEDVSMGSGTVNWLFFDTTTNHVVVGGSGAALYTNQVVLGVFWKSGSNKPLVFIPGRYTINNSEIWMSDITSYNIIKNYYIYSTTPISFDFTNNIVKFPSSFNIAFGSNIVSVSNHANVSIPTSTTAGWIYFDTLTNTVVLPTSYSNLPTTYVLLGWWNSSTRKVILNALVNQDNKVLSFLGDSITYGTNTTKTYWQYIMDDTGYTCNNYGVGGTCVSSGGQQSSDAFINRYSNIASTSDYIIVFGGTNDYGSNVPLGNINSTDNNTFYGAYNNLLEGLINTYPNAKVICITPLRRYYKGTGTVYVSGDTANSAGYKLSDYVQAVKDVAAKYSTPLVDLYTESGLRPENATQFTKYMPDGLHPNADGHKRLYKRVLNKIINY